MELLGTLACSIPENEFLEEAYPTILNLPIFLILGYIWSLEIWK